jgi:DNA modification methylase
MYMRDEVSGISKSDCEAGNFLKDGMRRGMPNGVIQLVVTSPPYNLGKEYESRLHLDDYLEEQREVITECVRVLADGGSICWQVGNYVDAGAIIPLDSLLYPVFASFGLKMRNRIVWHFEHELRWQN